MKIPTLQELERILENIRSNEPAEDGAGFKVYSLARESNVLLDMAQLARLSAPQGCFGIGLYLGLVLAENLEAIAELEKLVK